MNIVLALIGVGCAGILLSIGAAANARLKQSLHSAIAAAAINFLVGFSLLSLLMATGLFQWPMLSHWTVTPWWAFLGGLLGAVFVSLNTLTIPKLGLTATTLAVVCSQMMMSLVIDQFGWFGVHAHPLNGTRVIAIVLLLIATALTQLDDHHPHPRQAESLR